MKNGFRRFCTISLHVIGMGGFAFHLDYLVDLLYNMRDRIQNQLPTDAHAAAENGFTDGRTKDARNLESNSQKETDKEGGMAKNGNDDAGTNDEVETEPAATDQVAEVEGNAHGVE